MQTSVIINSTKRTTISALLGQISRHSHRHPLLTARKRLTFLMVRSWLNLRCDLFRCFVRHHLFRPWVASLWLRVKPTVGIPPKAQIAEGIHLAVPTAARYSIPRSLFVDPCIVLGLHLPAHPLPHTWHRRLGPWALWRCQP